MRPTLTTADPAASSCGAGDDATAPASARVLPFTAATQDNRPTRAERTFFEQEPWLRTRQKLERLARERPDLVAMVGNAVDALLDKLLQGTAGTEILGAASAPADDAPSTPSLD